jgi:predicted house-cleaning noncanonical NTP pyrophosphatase (MazG superfamily)
MGKLVRDRTREVLEPQNPRIVFGRVMNDQRRGLLFSKLLEEAGEWLCANDREQKLKELADLAEVIWALGEMDGIGQAEIVLHASGKRAARGGFDELLVMTVETGGEPTPTPQPTTTHIFSSPAGDGPWYSG